MYRRGFLPDLLAGETGDVRWYGGALPGFGFGDVWWLGEGGDVAVDGPVWCVRFGCGRCCANDFFGATIDRRM